MTNGLAYNDVRLERKEEELIEGFVQSGTCSIHATFKNYNKSKSCYRFFENKKVRSDILIEKLKSKCSSNIVGKDILVILDTTSICLDRYKGRITNFEGIGTIRGNQFKTQCGFNLHPLYVVDEHNGSPYGIADVTFINRPMEANKLSVQERKHLHFKLPIEQKESNRWLAPCIDSHKTVLSKANRVTYIMDREADIWEIYDRFPKQEMNFVIRLKQNRMVINQDGLARKVREQLDSQSSQGSLGLSYKDNNGKNKQSTASVKWCRCRIKPPKHKKGQNSELMYCIEVKKKHSGTGKDIHWLLWTNHEVKNLAQAKGIIEMYVKRWQIEVYFKLLKTDGFNIENTQLEKGPSIKKLVLVIMDAALIVQQLKAARSGDTLMKVKDVFTHEEICCMIQLNKKLEGNTKKQQNPYSPDHLSWASWIIARLAGWQEFYTDKSPPGNKTLTDGLEKFKVLYLGYSIAN